MTQAENIRALLEDPAIPRGLRRRWLRVIARLERGKHPYRQITRLTRRTAKALGCLDEFERSMN